jgi:hypothetical protein
MDRRCGEAAGKAGNRAFLLGGVTRVAAGVILKEFVLLLCLGFVLIARSYVSLFIFVPFLLADLGSTFLAGGVLGSTYNIKFSLEFCKYYTTNKGMSDGGSTTAPRKHEIKK